MAAWQAISRCQALATMLSLLCAHILALALGYLYRPQHHVCHMHVCRTGAAVQVRGKWRTHYARHGNKGIVALGLLMALTGMALIVSSMQPKASPVTSGGGTGPSRGEVSALQRSAQPARRKSSATSGCPMLRVPKVRLAPCACAALPRHTADKAATPCHAAVSILARPYVRADLCCPNVATEHKALACLPSMGPTSGKHLPKDTCRANSACRWR